MSHPHILVLFFIDRRVTRIVRIAGRRNRAGGALARRRRARRRILHCVVVRVRAGRAAVRPIARNRNRSDARRALRPHRRVLLLSRDCPCGRCSSGIRTRYTPACAGCSTYELPNGGRPGLEPGRSALRARLPSSAHGDMRCRDEPGSAAAHQQGFVNPDSWASGTSGAFYLARSVPAGVSILEKSQIIEVKGEIILSGRWGLNIRWWLDPEMSIQ